MEDATKALAKTIAMINSDSVQKDLDSGGDTSPQPDAEVARKDQVDDVSTDEKALDRWFREQFDCNWFSCRRTRHSYHSSIT